MIPKPEPLKTVRARKKRLEAKALQKARAECVSRDFYCRVSAATFLGPCSGPSEFAHLPSHRRSKTRGQAPEDRHDSRYAMMACKLHHVLLDTHRYSLEAVHPTVGAWGPLRVTSAALGLSTDI